LYSSLWASCDELRGGMDAAIEVLAQRRDKAQKLKQGMMQQLLTGRVRLLEPEKTGFQYEIPEPELQKVAEKESF